MSEPAITFHTFAIDTPDPVGLAQFYCDLAGGSIESTSDDWVTISYPSGEHLSFQLAPDLVAPTWPDPTVPIQAHPDFWVSDYLPADDHAIRLGARLLEDETGHPGFRVYADPSGHPFCLCLH